MQVTGDYPIPLSDRSRTYPFRQMQVGQSFTCSKPHKAVTSAAANYAKRNGVKFLTRKIETGEIRVWRVA